MGRRLAHEVAALGGGPTIVADRADDDIVVLRLAGDHDLWTAPALRSEVRHALLEHRGVVLELSLTTFLDSSVLGVIVGGIRRAREKSLGFALVLPDDPRSGVARTLDMTGLLTVFPVFRTEQAAADAVRDGQNEPRGWREPDTIDVI